MDAKPRVIDLDKILAESRTKVRYGRASLTVEKKVFVALTPVEETLGAHREGKASDEDLAWTFVKSQVVSHSPSFKWEDAELGKLLPLITAVATDPKLKATTPQELPPELEAAEKKELKEWAETGKELKKHTSRIAADLAKVMNVTQKPVVNEVMRKNLVSIKPPKVVVPTATAIGLKKLQDLQFSWAKMGQQILPKIPTAGFVGLDPSFTAAVLRGFAAPEMPKPKFGTSNWDHLVEQFVETAREADSPDVAQAVEAAVETTAAAEKREASDVDALLEGLQPMFADLERAIKETKKNSIARQFLIALGVGFILLVLQGTLARMGLPIVPQAPPVEIVVPQDTQKVAPKPKAVKSKKEQKRPATKGAKSEGSKKAKRPSS